MNPALEIYKNLRAHLTTMSLVAIAVIIYILDDNAWVNEWLPINGKPLAIGSLILISAVHERLTLRLREAHESMLLKFSEVLTSYDTILGALTAMQKQARVDQLTTAVNTMYTHWVADGKKPIVSEYTRIELYKLIDERKILGANSYVQKKLERLEVNVKDISNV